MTHILKLAGTATLVYGIASLGCWNIPGVIAAALVLNVICGALLKTTEVKDGKVHSEK